MIKITGETPEFIRVQTGWHSFDRALADQTEIGLPLGQIAEIYGPNGVGKSTWVQSLAFVLGKNIAYADFEGINVKLAVANSELQKYDGELYRIQDKSDEKVLLSLLKSLKDKKFDVGIVDAIGSISPVSEEEGDLGDANMGRRAFLMAQFCRRANHILLNSPKKMLFLLNHQHPRIGGLGTTTPGGETKKYSATIRIQLTRMRRANKEEIYDDGSYVLKGTVIKNRWGLEDRNFYAFVLAGKGVHRGLTAMYDGIMTGAVKVERTIKIGDKNFGYLKGIVEKAQEGDEEYFIPFYDALLGKELEVITDEEEGEE